MGESDGEQGEKLLEELRSRVSGQKVTKVGGRVREQLIREEQTEVDVENQSFILVSDLKEFRSVSSTVLHPVSR